PYRRIRLLRLTRRYAGGRRPGQGREAHHHERPRALSDERKPRDLSPLPQARAAGNRQLDLSQRWAVGAPESLVSWRSFSPVALSTSSGYTRPTATPKPTLVRT